ncbi:uncharacterized protein SGFS_070560 [Streptomyces graminofaciens]|uniref:Amidohydrolase n=1 Tax=Streptomyces graminofaciens TaxID=68212 RepID=A0ABM7FHW6_9ACTN|nr:hypothetical protein [Streptomyces graminofaciens]BBC35762.1 uncharacterized protein SGFS_070560 [Streptomyces graminofaciens]
MRTIHTAPLVLPVGAAPVVDGAVLVEGDRVAAIGRYADIADEGVRVRRWPGVLTPGLRQLHGRWLLTRCYHPDPREADTLGTEPITGAALDTLAPDATRMAGSVRRGLQRMLAHGTTHLGGPFPDGVRQAVTRSGLREVPDAWRQAAPAWDGPALDPFVEGYDLPGTVHGPLAVGELADFAVFDVEDESALTAKGAGTCVATVLGGRLVHRRR